MKKRVSMIWPHSQQSQNGGAKKPTNFNITEDQWALCPIARPCWDPAQVPSKSCH